MNKKILIQNKSFQLVLSTEYNTEILNLLTNLTLGSRGVIYSHKNVKERIKKTKNPYFLSLYKNNKILGNITFSHRELDSPEGKINAYYIRYFAFQEMFKSSKKKSLKKANFNSLFKRIILNLFKNGIYQSDLNHGENPNLPFIFYAYIDDENTRSMNMSNIFNFEVLGKFNTITFNRINPNKRCEIEKINPTEISEISKDLNIFFNKCSFYHDHDLFRNNDYYILKDSQNRIIIGAQVHQCLWEIKSMGNPLKNFLLKSTTLLPGIRKWLNLKELNFINIDHMYVANEKYYSKLILFIETLSFKFNLNLSMMWFDSRNPIGNYLIKSGQLGIISKFKKVIPANILIKYSDTITDKQKNYFQSSTCFLSGYDMT